MQTNTKQIVGVTIMELWREYQFLTGELTKQSRRLAFGLIAICWLFPQFSSVWILNCTMLFFVFDIFQYFFGAIMIRIFTQFQEKRIKEHNLTKNVLMPIWLDAPAFTLFSVKIFVLLISLLALAAGIFGSLENSV